MARIRLIEVSNFRCLKSFRWCPSPGINCLIGPGDSGKSTVLDAIDLCLGARRHAQLVDADFHELAVDVPIQIAITIGELEEPLKKLDSYGNFFRGFDTTTGVVVDEPVDGTELALTVLFVVKGDLEPTWSLYSERAETGGHTRVLSWLDRAKLAPTWIGATAGHHLSWRRGSVLTRISEEKADVAEALAKVARDARIAFGDKADVQLAEALKVVTEAATNLGIQGAHEPKALLDAASISFTGGAIALHTSSGVPLTSLGLGSARLLIAGLQRRAGAASAMLLADELEHGLEPHRIIRLLSSLGSKESPPPLQVFATTHSAVALRELDGSQLHVVRSKHGVHACTPVGTDDASQGTIRSNPEAFLAASVIVCEGASEIGFLRGIDQWRVAQGIPSLSARGIALADGKGVSQVVGRASALSRLGYPTLVFRDDDKQPDSEQEAAYKNTGGVVSKWRFGQAIENAIFRYLPAPAIPVLIDRAVEWNGADKVDANIRSVDTDFDIARCKTQCGARERIVLGRAAKSKTDGWFKDISRMEEVARDIVGPNLNACASSFRDVIEEIFSWSSRH